MKHETFYSANLYVFHSNQKTQHVTTTKNVRISKITTIAPRMYQECRTYMQTTCISISIKPCIQSVAASRAPLLCSFHILVQICFRHNNGTKWVTSCTQRTYHKNVRDSDIPDSKEAKKNKLKMCHMRANDNNEQVNSFRYVMYSICPELKLKLKFRKIRITNWKLLFVLRSPFFGRAVSYDCHFDLMCITKLFKTTVSSVHFFKL